MQINFSSPKRLENKENVYAIDITTDIILPQLLKWADGKLIPDISIQSTIDSYRENVLYWLVRNRSFFRAPPTYESIHAITPVWGIIIQTRNHEILWAPEQIFEKDVSWKDTILHANIQLRLKGIEISRSTIRPIWIMTVKEILPDPSLQKDGVIDLDFDFSERRDEIQSVCSNEFEEDENGEVVWLSDPVMKKRFLKEQVRQALRRLAEARMAVDTAKERFYENFDLSEGESDFSDDDEED